MNVFRSNRPLGITLIAIYFVIIGALSLLASLMHVLNLIILLETLERSNMPFFLFVISNLLLPALMVACGIALFNRKAWGWLGIAVLSAINILVFILLPLVFFGASSYVSLLQGSWIIAIPLISLIYLLQNNTMQTYDFSGDSRKYAIISTSIIALILTTLITVLSPNPLKQQIISNNPINTDSPDVRPTNQAARSPAGY
jgi:hypothetical protein